MMSQNVGLPEELHGPIRKMKKKYTTDLIALKCRPDYSKLLMLQYLQKQGVRLACCSNAIVSSVEDMLCRTELIDFFEFVIGNDQGFASKPEPDIYLEAFRRLNLSPDDIWIVEDAPHGVEAAKRAKASKVIEVKGFDDVHLGLFLNTTT
jgi:HAD superfamily hydrolase (TIGR01509 family)